MDNIVLTDKPQVGESVPRFVIIPNFERYIINENGEIYTTDTHKKVSTYIGIDDYEHCVLFMRGKRYRKRVHSLMGKAFLGNPQVVNHKDGNKHNNKLFNLERSTHSQNIQHAYDNGMYKNTKMVSLSIIDKETGDVVQSKSMREAERITGIDRHRIKTFLMGTHQNYTKWDFKYNE